MNKMAKKDKTNVMRILDQQRLDYDAYHFEGDTPSIPDAPIYKTLVTVGKSKEHYVFVIPLDCELDLKKAAQVVGEKSIHMIKEKELLPLTGYVHGGCSPIGMKKHFITILDESAKMLDKIIFSGGRVKFSVGMKPDQLLELVNGQYGNVASEH